jgi:hypothetical protein
MVCPRLLPEAIVLPNGAWPIRAFAPQGGAVGSDSSSIPCGTSNITTTWSWSGMGRNWLYKEGTVSLFGLGSICNPNKTVLAKEVL